MARSASLSSAHGPAHSALQRAEVPKRSETGAAARLRYNQPGCLEGETGGKLELILHSYLWADFYGFIYNLGISFRSFDGLLSS